MKHLLLGFVLLVEFVAVFLLDAMLTASPERYFAMALYVAWLVDVATWRGTLKWFGSEAWYRRVQPQDDAKVTMYGQ